ncbi:MAG: hypothetical protein MUE49_08725 [Rhodospirillales bacterium]|nr:hypothetical protein [Rhodospirillales bacterium]
MPNPMQTLIAIQMRFWYQWLDTMQNLFHAAGVWGQAPAQPTVKPAPVVSLVPRRGGCVGPADLER